MSEEELAPNPVFEQRDTEERRAAFEESFRLVREATPGAIVRQIDATTVHFVAPGISVAFETKHLAGVEALAAMLRSMAGR